MANSGTSLYTTYSYQQYSIVCRYTAGIIRTADSGRPGSANYYTSYNNTRTGFVSNHIQPHNAWNALIVRRTCTSVPVPGTPLLCYYCTVRYFTAVCRGTEVYRYRVPSCVLCCLLLLRLAVCTHSFEHHTHRSKSTVLYCTRYSSLRVRSTGIYKKEEKRCHFVQLTCRLSNCRIIKKEYCATYCSCASHLFISLIFWGGEGKWPHTVNNFHPVTKVTTDSLSGKIIFKGARNATKVI